MPGAAAPHPVTDLDTGWALPRRIGSLVRAVALFGALTMLTAWQQVTNYLRS